LRSDQSPCAQSPKTGPVWALVPLNTSPPSHPFCSRDRSRGLTCAYRSRPDRRGPADDFEFPSPRQLAYILLARSCDRHPLTRAAPDSQSPRVQALSLLSTENSFHQEPLPARRYEIRFAAVHINSHVAGSLSLELPLHHFCQALSDSPCLAFIFALNHDPDQRLGP